MKHFINFFILNIQKIDFIIFNNKINRMSYFEICGNSDDEDVNVLINISYGGYRIPDSILKERNLRAIKNGDLANIDYYELFRNDKYLIEIYRDIRDGIVDYSKYESNTNNIQITTIPRDAINADAWVCDEYDGCESITIDYLKIEVWKEKKKLLDKLNEIKKISLSNINSNAKINLINKLL